MSRKLFVSIPMHGYDLEEVKDEINWVKKIIETNLDETFDIIENAVDYEVEDDVNYDRPYFLSKAIEKISKADIVVFHPYWTNAKGCMIEHMICAMYNIPYMELQETDISNSTEDENV